MLWSVFVYVASDDRFGQWYIQPQWWARAFSQTALAYHFDARPAGTGGRMHADLPYLSFQSRMLSFLLPNASFYISQVLLTH